MKRKKCMIDGCNNLTANTGNGKYRKICSNHHKKKYNMPGSYFIRAKKLGILDQLKKCPLCGWEGPCDIHRIIPSSEGGKYEKGNIIVACPNCHRLIHRAWSKLWAEKKAHKDSFAHPI